MRPCLQLLHKEAAAKNSLLADLFVWVDELEAELDKHAYVLERLRTVMAEQAIEGRLHGEELTHLDEELRLERQAHAAARTQLEKGHTTLARVEAQL